MAKNSVKSKAATHPHVFHGSKYILIGVVLLVGLIGSMTYHFAGRSQASGCVSNIYRSGNSATCVKYLERMLNGITEVYKGKKYSFSSETLNSYMVTVDTYYSSNTKGRVVNFQRWGYYLDDDGIVGPKTWAEVCGFAKTIMLTVPEPWSSKVTDLANSYNSASCSTANKSSNPNIVYTAPSTTTAPAPAPTEPTQPAPAPAPTTSTGATTPITIASWNLKSPDNSESNLYNGLKSILSTAHVVGVQEFHTDSKRRYIRDKLLCSSCAYAGYIQNYDHNGSSAASVGIIWNKSKVSQVATGYQKVSDKIGPFSDNTGSNMYISSKWVSWVKLKESSTGKQFYVMNTHTVASVESGGMPQTSNNERVANFVRHMDVLTSLIKSKQADNVPIFVTGDFNVNYRYDSDDKYKDFPYVRLGAVALKSNWQATNLSGISSGAETQGSSNRLIDYVFLSNRSDVTANSTSIGSDRFGSDHNPVYLKATLVN